MASSPSPFRLLRLYLGVCFKIVLLIIIFPLFIVFVCPIYMTRFLVLGLSKILRPDLVAILGVRDMFYAVDDINTFPKSSVVITMVCKGQLTKEMVIERANICLAIQLPESKRLMYPEMKRYLVKWLGFIFMKEDDKFSVENHVKYIDPTSFKGEIADENALREIEKALVQEPYPEKKSYWSINILQNYKPREFPPQWSIEHSSVPQIGEGYSVVFLKVHHYNVDGYSLLNLALNVFFWGLPPGQLSLPNFPQRSFLETLFLKLFIVVKAPYDILSDALMDHDNNPWYLTRDRVTNVINSATSHRIPSQKIKNIAKGTGASFTGVIVAAISGGVRRFMSDRGEKVDADSVFTCLVPFPMPGHPETLGNYMSDCYVDFPIGIADRSIRLKRIEKQLNQIKYSTTSLSSFVMQPIFGGLFHWMVKPLVEFATAKSTGIFSSFPIPRVECMGPSGELVDAYYTAGHDNPGIGIHFLAINYSQGWKLKIQADKGTLSSDDEVEKLLSHVLNELDNYEYNAFDA